MPNISPSRLLLGLLLALLDVPAHAAPSADLLAPGGWNLASPHPGDVMLQETPSGGELTETLTVAVPSEPFYMEQIIRVLPADIPEGHLLHLHFQARSTTNSPMRVTVEKNGPPYPAALNLETKLTPQWQTFDLDGVSPGYGPNGLSAHFQVGQQVGVIDLRGIRLVDRGLDPAITAANAALKPEAMQARIRKYRMGTLTVRVVDRNGRPVRNASVEIAQTRHAFLFGCNAFGVNTADSSPSEKAYQTEFAALFNYATLPFYWGAFEPVQGEHDYARLQAMADWCLAHQITPKGHPLVWHQVWPQWAPATPDAAIPLLHSRVTDLVTHYKDSIHYWDVLNEANGAVGTPPLNGESEWIKRDGPAPVVQTALSWARAAGTREAETFIYNDYDTSDSNLALLSQLQQSGSLPDAVGLQSHMHSGVWPLAKLWSVCQRFSKFGRPIHFTETTILSGSNRNIDFNGPYPTGWNTTPEGETAQADYVTQFYTVLFSHPSLRAITWWDFSDKDAWLNAPAGLVRRDMSPKPAYTRLLTLIHKTWWTHLSAPTGSQGTLTRRVFYGQYTVTTCDKQGHRTTQSVFFPEAAGPLSVTVRVP